MISRQEKNKAIVHKIKKEKTISLSKKLLKLFFIIIILFTILFSYMYFIGVKGLKTKEYLIKDVIPKSFHGTKIVHFTDLLYGSTIDLEYLNDLKEEIKNVNPDIIIFTGNIISNEYKLDEEEINELKNFFKNLPYTIGKYAIKGNFDTATFDLIMDDTNFTVLNNEVIEVYNNSHDKIRIIGINENEIKEIKNDNDYYTITLINNYDNYNKYNLTSNLVLAGNNLGGEIRLGNIPLLGNNQYKNYYYEENNSIIYISSGIGTIHHMRLMNHPSINVYRLIKE